MTGDLEALWQGHSEEWRSPHQVATQWSGADDVDPQLLRHRVRGPFWELLAEHDLTLLVTREYEHLVMALTATPEPRATFLRLPHPSGLAVDRERGSVHVASTRNPNQVYELRPAAGRLDRADAPGEAAEDAPLVPVGSRFYPGALYLHDLAFVGGRLHGNAVGENAVARLEGGGRHERVWWPKAVERGGEPDFSRNHLQLNSIAAGPDVKRSFFSASAESPGARRPGHRNWTVDGRGVIFSGRTREPVARGLTRPHSARLRDGQLWVDNSGYGELSLVEDGGAAAVARLPGWTRGLCFAGDLAFVGVSRVIPRFRQYAPGLDVDRSICGVFAVDVRTGTVTAGLTWPRGNQIFAVDWIPRSWSAGFPFRAGRRSAAAVKDLFYAFQATTENDN